MMDGLLLLAIEADKPKPQPCKMAGMAGDLQTAVANIGQAIYGLKDEVKQVQETALMAAELAAKAANKKPPRAQKPSDYVMDVVRDDDGLIMRIDVKAV